jgi:hypothetical protein
MLVLDVSQFERPGLFYPVTVVLEQAGLDGHEPGCDGVEGCPLMY